MFTYDEIENYLSDIIDTIPEPLLEGLSGGFVLSPAAKHHAEIPSPNYWVMGEYCRNNLGRQIIIYYGSLMAVYPDAGVDHIKEELTKIVKHELRHHLEWRAGERTLEEEDERFKENALASLKKQRNGTGGHENGKMYGS